MHTFFVHELNQLIPLVQNLVLVILCVCGIVCIGGVIAIIGIVILIAFIATTPNGGIHGVCGTRLKELVLKDGAKELVLKELVLKELVVE